MKYTYEVRGARNVGLQYISGRVEAENPIDALKQAYALGKKEFGEVYLAMIIRGSIARGRRMAEFRSQVAAKKRSAIEDMPALATAMPQGMVRVRRPRGVGWDIAEGLENKL